MLTWTITGIQLKNTQITFRRLKLLESNFPKINKNNNPNVYTHRKLQHHTSVDQWDTHGGISNSSEYIK